MREILILDTETSGLDPKKDHLLEVGLVRWSVEHRTTIEATSWLVQAPGNPAEEINGIPPALLAFGRDISDAHAMVFRWEPKGKVWWRMMPSEDIAALPFRTRSVG